MKNYKLTFFLKRILLSLLVLFFSFSEQVLAFQVVFTPSATEMIEGDSVTTDVTIIPEKTDLSKSVTSCFIEFRSAIPEAGNHDTIIRSGFNNPLNGKDFTDSAVLNKDYTKQPAFEISSTISMVGFGELSISGKHRITVTYSSISDSENRESDEIFRDHYEIVTDCLDPPNVNDTHYPTITILNNDKRKVLTPKFEVLQSVVKEGAGEITVAELKVTPASELNSNTCSAGASQISLGGTAVEGEDFVLLTNSTSVFDAPNKSTVPVRIKLLDNLQSDDDRILRLRTDFGMIQDIDCRLAENGTTSIIKEIKIEATKKRDLTATLEQKVSTLKEGSGITEVGVISFKMPSGELPDTNCNATAKVTVIGGTAEQGKDFNFTEKLISYKLGDVNSKKVPISLDVLPGVADEDKTVKLQVVYSNTLGANTSCPLVGPNSQVVEIAITDDTYDKPEISISANSSVATEGESITMRVSLQPTQILRPQSARSIGSCRLSVDWITTTAPSAASAREGLDYIIVNKPEEIDFSKSNPTEIELQILDDNLLETDEKIELSATFKGKVDANSPQCGLIPETSATLANVVIKDKIVAQRDTPEPEELNDQICAALVDSVGSVSELMDNDKKYYDSNCKDQTTTTLRNFEPEEIATQTNAVLGAANRQLRNIHSRLDKLRSSNGQRGIDVAGANLNIQGTTLSIGLLGGGASGDENELLKNSHWGLFANGEYAFGKKDRGNDLKVGSGDRNFDFNSTGLTVGVDYRFPGEKMIAGAAIGYKDFESDFSDQKGFTNTKGTNVSLYGTYLLSDKSYLDAVIGFGKDRIDSRRPVNNDGSTNEETFAIGKPDAKEYTFSVGGGYEFHREQWTFSPYGRLDYTKGTIDAYEEVASHVSADTSMFSINKQSVEALTSSLGLKASRVYSTSKGVFIPQASLEWKHDFKERGAISGNSIFLKDFNTSLLSDSAFEENQRSELDKDYYNLNVGVSAVLPKGRSAYLNFESRFGDSTIKDNAVKAGFRWEF